MFTITALWIEELYLSEHKEFVAIFSDILTKLANKTLYHVATISAIHSIRAGINPGNNIWAQYGKGFYTFAKRGDARKWQRLRPILLDTSEEHVILEFRIQRHIWKRLKRKRVPESYNWHIPQNWIREFDILECHWGVTPETSALRGAKQYKFNPSTYEILDSALVR